MNKSFVLQLLDGNLDCFLLRLVISHAYIEIIFIIHWKSFNCWDEWKQIRTVTNIFKFFPLFCLVFESHLSDSTWKYALLFFIINRVQKCIMFCQNFQWREINKAFEWKILWKFLDKTAFSEVINSEEALYQVLNGRGISE